MFPNKIYARMVTIMGILILSNGSAFSQSDRSSVIIENESVQRSLDAQLGNNSAGSNQNNSYGMPEVGRPFNPSGVNAPQPSGFNSDRPTGLHSPYPSAFNPSNTSGSNPANP